MTKITIVEVQRINDRTLEIGHKVTVEHNDKKREKICLFDTLYGEEAWLACLITDDEENLEDTDWIETLPLANEKTKWAHKTYQYNSFKEFDNAGWANCQTRAFIWNCEDEMTND